VLAARAVVGDRGESQSDEVRSEESDADASARVADADGSVGFDGTLTGRQSAAAAPEIA